MQQPNAYETDDFGGNEVARLPELGVPTKKPRVRFLDIAVLIVSFGCCAVAVMIVRYPIIAWFLGYQYQLVVIGLTLSIMSVCLSYSRTYLLVLLEARFGRSTLQNYDAILQRTMYGPRTDFHWRLILLVLWLLPLGLSVAYKLFSVTFVSTATTYTRPIDFGFFSPIGLEKAGYGVALMANISLPFMQETTSPDNFDADPPWKFEPRTYGLNTLSISNTATAVLDLPSPQFIDSFREDLQPGETWHLKADVIATVARVNSTIEQHRKFSNSSSSEFRKYYWDRAPQRAEGLWSNDWKIWMVNNQKEHDQSWLFLSIQPDPSEESEFWARAKMFSIWREPCTGEWNITRTTMQLVDGKCGTDRVPESLDSTYQKILTTTSLGLDQYYLPTLLEVLGPFSIERNDSEWLLPTMTATVAGMMYSRVTALNGTSGESLPLNRYPVNGLEVTSTRRALRDSLGLLMVLGVQPTLLVISMATTWMLYGVPIDRTFGLISILAGIDRVSLQRLRGASLSSKLRKSIRLVIAVDNPDIDEPKIRYTIDGEEKVDRTSIIGGKVYG